MIRFATPDNFVSGDPVVLSGPGAIGASPGTTYYVRVLDSLHGRALHDQGGRARQRHQLRQGRTSAAARSARITKLCSRTSALLTRRRRRSSPSNKAGVDVKPTDYSTSSEAPERHRPRPGLRRERQRAKTQCDPPFCHHRRPLHRGEGHLPHDRAVGRRPDKRRHLLRDRGQPVRHPAPRGEPRGHPDLQLQLRHELHDRPQRRMPIHIGAPSDTSGVQEIAPAPIRRPHRRLHLQGRLLSPPPPARCSSTRPAAAGAIAVFSQEVDNRATARRPRSR